MFPARAGMNRADECACVRDFCVPRTRGDEPSHQLQIREGPMRRIGEVETGARWRYIRRSNSYFWRSGLIRRAGEDRLRV